MVDKPDDKGLKGVFTEYAPGGQDFFELKLPEEAHDGGFPDHGVVD